MIADCRAMKIDMIITKSISENCIWEIRRRFETGKHKMSTKRFLGYDTDETGKLVINRTQESIVVWLY